MKEDKEISLLKDEQLKSVAGGYIFEGKSWTPIQPLKELGNGAVACPKCWGERALCWDGKADMNIDGYFTDTYRFHCEKCWRGFLKTPGGDWYIVKEPI